MVATKQLKLAIETDEKRKARLVGRQRKKEEQKMDRRASGLIPRIKKIQFQSKLNPIYFCSSSC